MLIFMNNNESITLENSSYGNKNELYLQKMRLVWKQHQCIISDAPFKG